MTHSIELMLGRLFVCILLIVPFAQAADDDINIPYTDTYGYVYDAATGSFVKNGTPAASADAGTSSPATVHAAQSATADTASTPAPLTAAPAIPDTATSTDPNSSHMPWLVLTVLGIGIAVWRLLPRSKAEPVHNPDL